MTMLIPGAAKKRESCLIDNISKTSQQKPIKFCMHSLTVYESMCAKYDFKISHTSKIIKLIVGRASFDLRQNHFANLQKLCYFKNQLITVKFTSN